MKLGQYSSDVHRDSIAVMHDIHYNCWEVFSVIGGHMFIIPIVCDIITGWKLVRVFRSETFWVLMRII